VQNIYIYMKEIQTRFIKLQSMPIWVDTDEKIIYPSDRDGSLKMEDGILLMDINQNWYNYLDAEEKEFLINLINKT
jgi:hypothetical protein